MPQDTLPHWPEWPYWGTGGDHGFVLAVVFGAFAVESGCGGHGGDP